jgi:hypothetical protein
MKKLVLVGIALFVLLVGVIATYQITVTSEADAITELSKHDAPIIAQQSCTIIQIQKPVTDIRSVTENPKQVTAFLYYSVNGEIARQPINISTMETSETKIKDLVATECEKALLAITSEKQTETKAVIIDYTAGDLNKLKNAVYDMVGKVWNTTTTP